jgi:hypothetical protein
VKQALNDQYNEQWHSRIENSSKALTYKLFKDNLTPEPYIESLDARNAIILCKLEPLTINY